MFMTTFACKKCYANTKVIDSRASIGSVWRRRECTKCGERFTTYEDEKPPIRVDKIKHTLETIAEKIESLNNLLT